MKLIAPCQKCTTPPNPAVMMTGELDNDLLAICSCPNGHRYVVHQAHSVPEIIYSAGVRAFLAGFYSESVVTLTAALERGYELFVKVHLRASGKSSSDIDTFWKELRTSSERQLGAFAAIYFSQTGASWKTSSKHAEFRNNVAHRGYISSRDEAHRYGDYITTTLNRIMSHVIVHNQEAFRQHLQAGRAAFGRKADAMRAADPELDRCLAGSSALEWNNAGLAEPTFDDALRATASYVRQYSSGT